MPLVEKRYAEALVAISEQEGAIDTYQQQLWLVVDIFDTQSDFRLFLLNPEVRDDIKKDLIKKLFDGTILANMVNFLLLLLEKGRIGYLPGILKEYIVQADKKRNILDMTIISGLSLDEGQVNSIKEKYRKLYGATSVKAQVQVDESVIGGVKVRIGDKVIDGTVMGRLKGLEKLLLEG